MYVKMLGRIRMRKQEFETLVGSMKDKIPSKEIPKKRVNLTGKITRALLISFLLRVGWHSRNTLLTGVLNLTDSVKTSAAATSENHDSRENPTLVQTYTILKEDTLYSLAKKYNTSVDEILALNPEITDEDQIYINQDITLFVR